MAAADIGEALDCGEVVSLDDRLRRDRGRIGHGVLEGLALPGPFGEHLPNMLAIGLAYAVGSGAQARRDVLIGAGGEFLAEHHRHGAQRARRVGPEQLADRGQREMARRPFPEHAEAREHAHHAIERGRVRARLGRDLLDRPWRAVHVIGDAEPRHA